MKLLSKHENETLDEKKIRTFSYWHFALMAFIVCWMVGAYIYLDRKTDLGINKPPVVVLDTSNVAGLSNMFIISKDNKQILPPSTSGKPAEFYEVREKYNFGDVVVIKFFYIEAVVLEKSATSDYYTVCYKDHSHVLQKTTLPRLMLLYPKEGVLNPVSLLVD